MKNKLSKILESKIKIKNKKKKLLSFFNDEVKQRKNNGYEKNKDLDNVVAEKLNSVDINFKKKFGEIPKSIMKFKKTNKLINLIDNDQSDMGLKTKKGAGYNAKQRYSVYNPDQAKFIIEYYTKPNDLILDPFQGRVTRPIISLYSNRRYIGFDVCSKTVDYNEKIIHKKLTPEKTDDRYLLIHGDGTKLENLKKENKIIDAVFTCPPYYNIETYSKEKGDISYFSFKDFDKSIDDMFIELSRLIKTSIYGERIYPVIITVSSVRKGKKGIIDMDFNFQMSAKKAGFVLYDKLFTENLTPGAGFTFRRNYVYGYVTKNYETTLVFAKFDN